MQLRTRKGQENYYQKKSGDIVNYEGWMQDIYNSVPRTLETLFSSTDMLHPIVNPLNGEFVVEREQEADEYGNPIERYSWRYTMRLPAPTNGTLFIETDLGHLLSHWYLMNHPGWSYIRTWNEQNLWNSIGQEREGVEITNAPKVASCFIRKGEPIIVKCLFGKFQMDEQMPVSPEELLTSENIDKRYRMSISLST